MGPYRSHVVKLPTYQFALALEVAIFLITISVGLDWYVSSFISVFQVTVFSALCLRDMTTFTLVTLLAKLCYLHRRLRVVITQGTVI
jgi:phosphoglycerol transferase MdoB-like AlkP superfamily enzyme